MTLTRKHIPYLILLAGILTALFRSLDAGGLGGLILAPWVLGPYIVTGLLFRLYLKRHPVVISLIITSLIMLILTILGYWDLTSSSTAAIVFIPVPVILLIIGSLFSWIGYLIESKIMTKHINK